MFWTSIQGSAFLFFRIFTSPLNSLYLYSFGGLFFSGWKRNSFFPLSPPSWLSLSSPLSSPPLIPSSPPLFSSEFPSFLFFSYPLLSHLILYFLQSSPPPYPHFSLTLSPLSIPSFFISSSLLPSSIFALILWQSLLLFPLQSSLLLYSSPKLITHSPYISYRALLYSALSFRLSVNIFWFSPSCHASFRTSSSFSFPFTSSPSTFYFSASHPTQFPIPERHVSKWSSGKQNLDKAQRSACQSLPSVHLFVCLCSPRSLPVPSIPPTLVSG